LIRKLLLTIALLAASSLLTAQQDIIEFTVDSGGVGTELIAVVPFSWQGSQPPIDVAEVIANNMERSGLFSPIARSDLPATPSEASDVIFRNWQLLGTPSLVIGAIETDASGEFIVRFRLFDVNTARQALGFEFQVPASKLRSIAHRISDLIFEHLTGVPGAFDTRIAYVTERILADGSSRYALNIADSDGFNSRNMLESSQPVLSPAWSPDGRRLAYVSYENRQAQIMVQNLATGKRRRVANFPGLNGAPAWSPDGKKLAMTLSKDGNPEIYILNLDSNRLRRLTKSVGIDTEAAWAPDGQSLVFTSSRSGKPNIYQIPAAGGHATRLTFEGTYNARASFSADGTKLVHVHAVEGKFKIAVLDLETQRLQVLTDSWLDESPSFAPNGSMILYSTTTASGGSLAAVSVDGRVRQRLAVQHGEVREPAWSPYRHTH